ncbi:MAG TPA: protein phosphatase 2C domain-containing protein [Rubrivivax sp.]|nr:protein phosphatase 2C domain-containing protein [Rubrivivax sp.]
MLAVEIALLSEPGGRSGNEDACGHWHSDDHLCCVLADGAGGHGGGDVASRLVVQTLLAAFADAPSEDGAALARLVRRANAALLERRQGDPRLRDMHTTLVCLVIDFVAARAHWVHAGDSRLYWFRHGRLHQRTLDHSLVQGLLQAGVLTPEQARSHPRRSELQSALGTRAEDLRIEAGGDVTLVPGDAFLLCSDGLWEFVDDEAMQDALAHSATAGAWVAALEQRVRAGARGHATHDNFSALAVRILSPEGAIDATTVVAPADARR